MQPRKPQSPSLFIGLIAVAAALLIAVVAIGLIAPRLTSSPTPVGGEFKVTIYPTHVVQTAEPTPATVVEAIPPTAAPAMEATVAPTPPATRYTVVQNDTLWDIGLKFGVTIDQIVAANPGLNPDLLSLGQVLNIPASDFIAPPRPTPGQFIAPPPSQVQVVLGLVAADAGGLRLRDRPSADGSVITKLGPSTQLQITGRTEDSAWLQVITPQGTQGWVMSQFVLVNGAPFSAGSSDGAQAEVESAPVVAPAQPPGPLDYPYLSDISPRVYQIFRLGQSLGNRADAFSVIGDSNTHNPAFMQPFGWGAYNLGSYSYLQATIDYFQGSGSFGRSSLAALGGWGTSNLLDPGSARAGCSGQMPLACELSANKPSVALILIGTGDHFGDYNHPQNWRDFESRYRRIIDYTVSQGVIPVLITKADDLEFTDGGAPPGFINSTIARLAGEYQVPLLNLRQVMDALPGRGTTSDGFHYSQPPDNRSADFTGGNLQYGYNQRNLTALQVLDVLRRKVFSAA
jgi:LysM repeat protein